MKQTLTEIAEILRAVDAGAKWEWNNPSGQETDWCYAKGAANPLFFAAQGWPIRIKPAEPDAEGWIPWKGGECPVPDGTLVDVKYKCGDVLKGVEATSDGGSDSPASRAYWCHDAMSYDIIAYRLAPEPEWTELGPKDVPPGSSIKHAEIEALVVRVGVGGVWIVGRTGTPYEIEFEELKDEWQINRSLPLTGKWDPQAWEPCRKLKPQDA